jgi:diguanylate cyclase (GGDEF)-like protein
LRWISKTRDLAALANAVLPPEEAVERALPILAESLGAENVYLVYGHDAGFRSFGTSGDQPFSDVACWLIHHDLTSRGRPCAFDAEDGRVQDFRSASSRKACQYIAAKIPLTSAGDMLVATGSWERGIGGQRIALIESVLPTLALLLERRLDASRAERQRNELNALANIARVLSESEDLETVLTSIGSAISRITAIDYVSIDIMDGDGRISMRSTNSLRPGTEDLRSRWTAGATKPDPVRDAVFRTHKLILMPDVQHDERVPERGRQFFVRTLIRSTAVFPLLVKDEILGVLHFASHRPLEFPPREVELLEGLSAQVAFAVKAIRLYQELAESREQHRRLNEQLQESMGIQHRLARTDALTGITNRRFIDETLEAEVARARRYGQPVSLVMTDVDELKVVNDSYSHAAGDEVLRFVAWLARESCREVDVVGRYGGDEFVFILPNTTLEHATNFAERFRERLARSQSPIPANGAHQITASLGVAEWEASSMESAPCLLRAADRAMYKAKSAGRNRTMLADGEGARAA